VFKNGDPSMPDEEVVRMIMADRGRVTLLERESCSSLRVDEVVPQFHPASVLVSLLDTFLTYSD
jgi:hypothetical protein